MEVINDTEVFQPSECFFAVGLDPDGSGSVMVCVSDKETFDREGCLNDCFGDHSMTDDAIPHGIHNTMEATWESIMPLEETRTAMLKAGFVESQDMYDYLFAREEE
jgi:hypothetical protein